MKIKIVNKRKQDKDTPINEVQYPGECWNCSSHRYMNMQQWFEFIKKCERKGGGTIYLYDIEARKENVLGGTDKEGNSINPREVITYWVNVDYKSKLNKDNMGSTNAMMNYKPEDIYNYILISKGKYDEEIVELDYGGDDGRMRAIVPNRAFCYMCGYSAIEGSANCCIVEIKPSFWVVTALPVFGV